MSTTTNNMDEMLDEISAIESFELKKREMLKALLDQALHDEGHLLVQKTHMGTSDSYVGAVTFRWIDKHVGLFTELALFNKKLDDKGNLIVDAETVEELKQRAPHWDRSYGLTAYLLRQRHRKFPPILVVVSEHWVDDPESGNWDKDGRATRTSMPIRFLDTNEQVGLMDFRTGVNTYAIDGSHRTIAIRGVMKAVGPERHIPIYSRAKKLVGSKSLDELLDDAGLSWVDVAGIEDETMGIEFIPAVITGETREEAAIRLRSAFVHVNKTAAPPTAGEQVVLDPDNGFAIISRKVGLTHPLFNQDNPGDRINWKSNSLPAGSRWIVPAVILADMAEAFLGFREPYIGWKPEKKREIPLRPSEGELDAGRQEFTDFIDRIAALPSFSAILRGDPVDEWREFPKKPGDKGRAHLLMRPLGQLALAQAVAHVHSHPDGPQKSLDIIFGKLKSFDEKGGFEAVDKSSSIWWGVTYNPIKGRMDMTGKSVAADMLIYLLGGASVEKREVLLNEFRARRAWEVDGKLHAVNFDGKTVAASDQIQLPPLL